MNDRFNDLSRYLLRLLSESEKGKLQTVFLNTPRIYDFKSFMESFSISDAPGTLLLVESAYNETVYPYYPLLTWIKNRTDEMPQEEIPDLLRRAGVYFLHESVILGFLTGEESDRKEVLLPEEISYEKEMLFESLWNLFKLAYWGERLVIAFDRVQDASFSLLEWIIHVASKNDDDSPILLVVSFDREFHPQAEERVEAWEDFIRVADNSLMTAEFSGGRVLVEKDTPKPAMFDVDEIFHGADFSINLFAFKDALKILLNLHHEWTLYPEIITENQLCGLFMLRGDAFYYLKEYDAALADYTSLLNTANQNGWNEITAEAYCRIGQCYLMHDNIEIAEKNARQCIKIASDIKSEYALFKGVLLTFQIEDKGRKQSIAKWRNSYNELIELTLKHGFQNIYTFVVTNPYGIYSEMYNAYVKMHLNGIDMAKRNRNMFRVAAAYQTLGLIHAVHGDYEKVLFYYEKSEEIKNLLGNKLEISYINNGMGFYHFMTGNYSEANVRYTKALAFLLEIKDFHEIGMTFYNLSVNAFFAFEHKLAVEYLEKTLIILRNIGMRNLSYHSLFGIFSLMGLSCCGLRDYLKAYQYFAKIGIMNLEPFPEKNEEFFEYNLLAALLADNENDPATAMKYFSEAELYLKKTNDNIGYMAPRFYYERASFYFRQGNEEEKSKSISLGRSKAEELHNSTYLDAFAALSAGAAYTSSAKSFETVSVDFDWIVYAAKMEKNIVTLHRKVEEIRFLNNFQAQCAREQDEVSLLRSSINFIHTSFPMDSIQYYRYVNGIWKLLLYRNSADVRKEYDLSSFADKAWEYGKPLFGDDSSQLIGIQDEKHDLESVLAVPVGIGEKRKDQLICFTLKGHVKMRRDDVDILQIAASQLDNAIGRIEQKRVILEKNRELQEANRKLEVASATDFLTGLGNRAALIDRINGEIERVRRRKNHDSTSSFSMMFLDLDNFKHYNDRFGHQTGDLLLIDFSHTIKEMIRKSDSAFRYGGDEFVIIMPETPKDKAAELAERILTWVFKQWTPVRDVLLLQGSEPEAEKLISCSIGITYFSPSEENTVDLVEKVIRDADDALYRAKSKGKGQYQLS